MGIQHDQPARPLRRCVDGVVLVDKPTGLTSNAVLQRVKRAYRALKAGHTGTLDPLASGLLPICLGEATKFSLGLLDADKRYRAVLHLGVTTETGDVEGAVLKTREVSADRGQIEHALLAFRGDIMQVPHRYSALKRDGRALYSYARAGEPVAIAPRRVRIHALDIEHWESPLLTVNVQLQQGHLRALAGRRYRRGAWMRSACQRASKIERRQVWHRARHRPRSTRRLERGGAGRGAFAGAGAGRLVSRG